MNVQSTLVLLLTLTCAITDFRAGKIYNKVTYPAALVGLLFSYFAGSPSLAQRLTGLAGALALYSLLRAIAGMGAGDVKLMAAVGAFKGLPFVLYSSFYIFCVACLISLVLLACRHRLLPVFRWIGATLIWVIYPRFERPELSGAMTTMPFGPSIFFGVALCLYLEAVYGQFAF